MNKPKCIPYHSPFTKLRYEWQVGFCSPEHRGNTSITVWATKNGAAKLQVVRKTFLGSAPRKFQVTKSLSAELLHQLQQAFANASLKFAVMPTFACDAGSSFLEASGDPWSFRLSYGTHEEEDGLEEFRERLREVYEPVLDAMNAKIREAMVATT
jgi:hypothetical protein